MAVEPETFKAVLGQWPSGVTVVTTVDAGGPAGMTASSFSSVSLEPPLVSVCIARPLAMHARIDKSGVFAVNILSKSNVDDGRRFAGMLPGVTNRFEGIDVSTAVTGSPLLPGTLGWVDCSVWARHDGGDHTIFVGEVLAAGIDKTAAPLLYHSRSWGQFADVLVSEVAVAHAGAEGPATVVTNAFGSRHDAPEPVDVIVARVRAALDSAAGAQALILDDAAAAADPLLVRLTIQAISGLVGRTPVALRLGAGPMALANVVVGLKSGIRRLSVSPGPEGPYVSEADLRVMLRRMGVAALP
jgi:flavin reductase (DIM6/NTAB) family NADH-FMN oxidoreductase RutF